MGWPPCSSCDAWPGGSPRVGYLCKNCIKDASKVEAELRETVAQLLILKKKVQRAQCPDYRLGRRFFPCAECVSEWEEKAALPSEKKTPSTLKEASNRKKE